MYVEDRSIDPLDVCSEMPWETDGDVSMECELVEDSSELLEEGEIPPSKSSSPEPLVSWDCPFVPTGDDADVVSWARGWLATRFRKLSRRSTSEIWI